ncbi:LacI family DNA-binding transcriptional regulator [Pseudomonas sp. EpS/L25]|uniref:LacI family DNA-binding transcriptional regulator n=1 Tax=Pseudomonas sp. EpS/L25 TaxID=1749078 RepID=UPI003FA68E2C
MARLAGVSPITVSRTLNQPEIVRPALREKVFRAVRESGYQPAMLTTGAAPQMSACRHRPPRHWVARAWPACSTPASAPRWWSAAPTPSPMGCLPKPMPAACGYRGNWP